MSVGLRSTKEQVLDTIIGPNPIKVVNYLIPSQGTTDMLSHH